MTNKQYQEKIQLFNKWANAYYVNDNPIATDEEYVEDLFIFSDEVI